MWIILLSPVTERYFFLSFVMYFLARSLLLFFFAVAAVVYLFFFFFTYSLFVFLSFQLSLEELLFVYPGPG